MGRNLFEGNPEFAEAMKLQEEANSELTGTRKKMEEARENAKQVREKLRKLRADKLEELKNRREELHEQEIAMEKEYRQMLTEFCKLRHRHEYSWRKVITSYREISHTIWGSVYPTERYYTCQICGDSNDLKLQRSKYRIWPPTKAGLEAIRQAAQSDESIEVRELAEKILAYPDRKKELLRLQEENQKDREELCRIFGHVMEEDGCAPYVTDYRCECCGKIEREFIGYASYFD